MSRAAIYTLTKQGCSLARQLKVSLDADLYIPEKYIQTYRGIPFKNLMSLVKNNFHAYRKHIFITATGIAVRAIAPCLEKKDSDPAVVVVDQRGHFCISLVGGHIGGANALAIKLAELINAIPVITTATDTENLPSIDMLAIKKDMAIGNIDAIKHVNMAILEGEPVQVFDPEGRLSLGSETSGMVNIREMTLNDTWQPEIPGIWVSWHNEGTLPSRYDKLLYLHPRCLVIGIGCNRGTGEEEIYNFILRTFKEKGLSLKSVKSLATIKAKRDEQGILKVAQKIGVPISFFDVSILENIKIPNPSETVKRHMGVPGVCEAAAIAGAEMGKLILPKIKDLNTTLAVALHP